MKIHQIPQIVQNRIISEAIQHSTISQVKISCKCIHLSEHNSLIIIRALQHVAFVLLGSKNEHRAACVQTNVGSSGNVQIGLLNFRGDFFEPLSAWIGLNFSFENREMNSRECAQCVRASGCRLFGCWLRWIVVSTNAFHVFDWMHLLNARILCLMFAHCSRISCTPDWLTGVMRG